MIKWVILIILSSSFLTLSSSDEIKHNFNKELHNYLMLKINILDPLEKKFGKLYITSLFRAWPKNSQHTAWKAANIDDWGRDYSNRDIYNFARDSLSFDQLIIYHQGKRMSHVHFSYSEGENRNEILRCYRWEGAKWYKKLN